jgi:hypothetical protein|nr:MAG TPA: hypothetical protein [Caudoviricetes sp.]DAX95263.1 MAG TPA: hypothetical protein [Caudoviricetes sp.]
MSTVDERVRLAFKAATGEDKALSGSWHAANSTHFLEVRNALGSRRREAIAQVTATDSLNVTYLAEVRRDWTSVEVMAHMLSDAERRVGALVTLADVLSANGWRVSPILELSTCGGLRASKDGNEVHVYSSGEVRGHDDVAVRFARDAFEVALERAQAA